VPQQTFHVSASSPGALFEGIGAVNGGGATSVLLKDYPEPQRSQILDLVFRPKFGASVSTMLVEVPGDGNATQGSMPSHQHTREDEDHHRGYIAWVLAEAKRRNPDLLTDAAAWSAPGWIGEGRFWHQDAADYYLTWLRGLREVHGVELDALGCRNEKGADLDFLVTLRDTLDAGGFAGVRLHAFDDWPADKFDFLRDLPAHPRARAALAAVGAHVLSDKRPGMPSGRAPAVVQRLLAETGLPLWNTEDHVYLDGFDALLGIAQCLNESYLHSGATRTVLWYDVAGVYPVQPYPEQPAMLLARWPWSGHYRVREGLWGYAHYGQFTEVGWRYADTGCGLLVGNGSVVSLVSPAGDYSVIVETSGAREPQHLAIRMDEGLTGGPVCVWRSTAEAQFDRLEDLPVTGGQITLVAEPGAVYSLSTTRGQEKGSFDGVPSPAEFPFPYREGFAGYGVDPARHGRLPRYTADIAGAFELVERPDGPGLCLRQMAPVPTISWAPDWQPYTILGDAGWTDYAVAVDVWLGAGERAGVMARVNHVGTGYGFVPQCYLLEVDGAGVVRLVVVRGKENKAELVGDAEQQELIRARGAAGPGGELELARASVPEVGTGQWHRLELRCAGSELVGSVDGAEVVRVRDGLYPTGQVGLLAGGPAIEDPAGLAARSEAAPGVLSRPYFAELEIVPMGAGSACQVDPAARAGGPGQVGFAVVRAPEVLYPGA